MKMFEEPNDIYLLQQKNKINLKSSIRIIPATELRFRSLVQSVAKKSV